MAKPHILIVSYPAQGHLSPSLQFARRLTEIGVEVTIVTSKFVHHLITKASCNASENFNFAPISDGYEDGFNPQGFHVNHLNAFQKFGPETLQNAIRASAQKGRPVTCVVYTILLTWAAKLAFEIDIPSALLWIQPATVLGIYYNYCHGYEDEIKYRSNDPNWSIQWSGLPLLSRHDLPSFILPSNSISSNFAAQMLKEQIKMLDEAKNPYVLVNTFDALESLALKCIEKYKMIGIGPLINYPFSGGNDLRNTSPGEDVSEISDDNYMDWLNSKPNRSVVYVAFGSVTTPSKQQIEEIARGLLDCDRPFLWVIRAKEDGGEEEKPSCIKELEEKGKIIPWSSQIEVLKHPSLGCFVTHCGWSSTLESIILGVPVVAFPQWSDQGTNAKLLQDVWRTGVRVIRNENGIVESNEIKRCIELVMDGGENGLELRRNVEKWKGLATAAMKDDGSSAKNLKAFVFEDIEQKLIG